MAENQNTAIENCTHDCSSCGASCPSRTPGSLLEPLNKASRIGKVVAVMSGKGGVGKSMVTSRLAVALREMGYKVGILDADITGPSIPKAFGVHDISVNDDGLVPAETEKGIKIMSLNLLMEDETTPVVWRGPIIGGTVKQFWTDVVWGNLDVLLVDMPPGTGDVPLTVFQSFPVDGVVVVTSPQELVSMIVEKAVRMAGEMNLRVLGIIENMSYVRCEHCGQPMYVFGRSHVEEIAAKYGIEVLEQIPLDPVLAQGADSGSIEQTGVPYFEQAAERICQLLAEEE